MAENQEIKSKRDLLTERLKARYPDKAYDDDEALYGQIYDDYDDYDERLGKYEEEEKKFADMFAADARSADLLMEMKEGKPLVVALVEKYGPDFVEELKDPEKQQEIAEASKRFAERIAEEKDYEEQYTRNIEESRALLDRMQDEEGLSVEETDAAFAFLMGVIKDGMLGKFSPETIHMALHAVNHDKDVEEASTEGEIRGRNAKIDEKLRKQGLGDGTASLDGKNGGAGIPRRGPELGALSGAGSTNIWERGGEKRKRYNY